MQINIRESPHQREERAFKDGLNCLYEVWRLMLRNLIGAGHHSPYVIYIPRHVAYGIVEMLTHSLKYMPTKDEKPKEELAKLIKYFEERPEEAGPPEERWFQIPVGRRTTLILQQLEAALLGYGINNEDGSLNKMMY